jgi:cellulose biosynthesis protein BcsQ
MKVFAVYNLKGGVGKTASSVNFGWFAANAGFRTLVWDLDPQGAATFYFRVRPKLRGGGKGLLRFKRGLARQVRATDYERLDLIPADPSNRHLDLFLARKKRPLARLRRSLRTIRKDYDIVLLDCAPGISLTSEAVFEASDALIIPVIPTPLSLRALDQVRHHLREHKHPPALHPFFCMVDLRRKMHRETMLARATDGFLVAPVPYSSRIEQMGTERRPLPAYAPNLAATHIYASLWNEILERERMLP